MNEYDQLIQQGGLSLERMATLCRVADAGGLSKAAGGDVSRLSLYSRQIKDLESFFGLPLTRKIGRNVVLTKAALDLAAKLRGQFKELSAFREKAGISSPTLLIGASHSVFEWWLWPQLSGLAKVLPEGTCIRAVALRSKDLVDAIESHVLDLGFVRTDAVPANLKSKSVFTMGYSLFVPQCLQPTGKRQNELISQLPLAMSMGGQVRERIEQAALRSGVTLDIRLECPSFTLAARAVLTGQYAAILPDLAESAFIGHPVTKLAVPFDGVAPRKIALTWHPLTPASRIKPILDAWNRPNRKEK